VRPRGPLHVLLLTADAPAHAALLRALRRHGLVARVSRRPALLERLLALRPAIVLVDVDRPVALTLRARCALAAARAATRVLALHSGSLEDAAGEVTELAPDGFVDRCDGERLAEHLTRTRAERAVALVN